MVKSSNISSFLKSIYLKIFKINDTPQRIALGLGLGVSLGIIPGSGPIAALFLAWVFRINRAAALLGSLLTNTWLSVVTFLLSIKLGSAILKVDWQNVSKDWGLFLKNFHLRDLFKLSILEVILPVIVGYFTVALSLGILAYLACLLILIKIRRKPR